MENLKNGKLIKNVKSPLILLDVEASFHGPHLLYDVERCHVFVSGVVHAGRCPWNDPEYVGFVPSTRVHKLTGIAALWPSDFSSIHRLPGM